MAVEFSWEAQAPNVEHFQETVAKWKGRKGALMPICKMLRSHLATYPGRLWNGQPKN